MYLTAHVDIPISQDKSGSKKVHNCNGLFYVYEDFWKASIFRSRYQPGS